MLFSLIKNLFLWLALSFLPYMVALLLPACGNTEAPQPAIKEKIAPVAKEWTFASEPVWADEFEYTGKPDATKWGYDTGGHGWGNNELQYYTESVNNAFVENGKLTLTARK